MPIGAILMRVLVEVQASMCTQTYNLIYYRFILLSHILLYELRNIRKVWTVAFPDL